MIQVVIPTLNRISKLENCLKSIFHAAKDISILLDVCFSIKEEKQYFEQWLKDIPNIRLHLITEYNVPDFWNSWLKNIEEEVDILIYLNDDVQVDVEMFKFILSYFKYYYPDLDGVVGINQVNIQCNNKVESAFGAIGKKYIDRFPDGMVFCPQYKRFYADQELWIYAKSINKFLFGELAKLNHYHPAFYKHLKDSTHDNARRYLQQDKQMFRKRQELGYLWGNNFDLVT